MARCLGQAARDQKGKRPAAAPGRLISSIRANRAAGEVGILFKDRKSGEAAVEGEVSRDSWRQKTKQPVPVVFPSWIHHACAGAVRSFEAKARTGEAQHAVPKIPNLPRRGPLHSSLIHRVYRDRQAGR